MKKLYLVCYFNEMESENDADVLIIDDQENQLKCFKEFFKEIHECEIEDKDVLNIYPIDILSSSDNSKYAVELKKIK